MSLKRKFNTGFTLISKACKGFALISKACKGFTLISKACKGFTLIELLVVIAILGILSVVGLGSFQSSQAKGRDAQRKQDLGQIQRALEMYYNDYKGYPLTADFVGFGVTWEDVNETLYMKTVPNDPRSGNYCYESDGLYYRLYAKLENTQDSKFIVPQSSTCTAADGYSYGVSSSNIAP